MQSLVKSSIINYELPGDLNSAIELSKKNNPDLIIAKLEYEQSIKDKSIATVSYTHLTLPTIYSV